MNELQKKLRLDALNLIRKFGKGSSGQNLSCVDLIEALYFGKENGRNIFKYDPKKPQWEGRDLFVLSKFEALPALYSVLKEAGYVLPEPLPFLPDRKTPGIEFSTNKNIAGFAGALGMAKIIRSERTPQHVFCLCADYEFEVGSAWEAVLLASKEKLDRLCLVIDENQNIDSRLQEKFEAFGWRVIKLREAHSHDDIAYAYMKARLTQRKPTVILASTVKSAGVSFAERRAEYDNVVFSDSEMEEIKKILI